MADRTTSLPFIILFSNARLKKLRYNVSGTMLTPLVKAVLAKPNMRV
jgi:hypothetical protein